MCLVVFAVAADSNDKAPAGVRTLLAAKYPAETIVTWCGGGFLGDRSGGVAALYNSEKRSYRVVWLTHGSSVRELQTVPAFEAGVQFELQCLDAKAARERKQTLEHSEAIRDFLHLPAGHGALCYFVSETETKCWSTDKKGNLLAIGGWQT